MGTGWVGAAATIVDEAGLRDLLKRPLIPVVIHVEGSGRLQKLTAAYRDPVCRWLRMIRLFEPKVVLDCFLRRGVGVLGDGQHGLDVDERDEASPER